MKFKNKIILFFTLILSMFFAACTQETVNNVIDIADGIITELDNYLEEDTVDYFLNETPTVAPTATPTVKPTATNAPSSASTATPTIKPTATNTPTSAPTATPTPEPKVVESGKYTSKDDVALYIYTFGHLPSNYLTKSEAEAKGWKSGNNSSLDKVCPGMSIGGDYFGNYEKLLPTKKGRKYYECDIDYVSGGRNAKRIIYSNDGLIYYTDDHYETFTKLYGDE